MYSLTFIISFTGDLHDHFISHHFKEVISRVVTPCRGYIKSWQNDYAPVRWIFSGAVGYPSMFVSHSIARDDRATRQKIPSLFNYLNIVPRRIGLPGLFWVINIYINIKKLRCIVGKIKIEVDTDGIFDNKEGCSNENCGNGQQSLTELIKSLVIYETKNAILKKISDDAKLEMQKQAAEAVNGAMKFHIEQTITSTISNLEVSSYYQSSKKTSIQEYIKERLEKEITSYQVEHVIKKIAENYTTTIKERYDRLFASQFLDKIMKAGLLKDEAISKLLLVEEDIKKQS
jgi:hypothetical protein